MKSQNKKSKALHAAHEAIKLGKKQDALNSVKGALAEDPNSLDALLLATTLSDPVDALEYAKRAVFVHPENERAKKALSWAEKRIKPAESKSLPSRKVKTTDHNEKPKFNFNHAILAGIISFFLLGFIVITWFGFPQITITFTQATTLENWSTPTPFQYIYPTPTSIPTSIPLNQPEQTYNNDISFYAKSWEIQNPQAGTDKFWIEVDLSEQMLRAWQGDKMLASFSVSTGTASYPTVTGSYKVYAKYTKYTMAGPGYYLPDVPYSLFFHKGYSIHGTYWHDNFGTPMSHGCVNMTISDAAWIYDNAPIGTVVFVHQ